MDDSKIEETTIEGIDGFFTKLTEAAEIVTQKLIAVAPDVAESLLNLVQAKGIFDLSVGLMSFISLTALSAWSWSKLASFPEGSPWSDLGIPWLIGNVLVTLVALGALFGDVLNFYSWVAAFYPEGAIALKALEAAGISL